MNASPKKPRSLSNSSKLKRPDSRAAERERPAAERFDPQVGRVILKYLSDDYLLNDKLTATDATDL